MALANYDLVILNGHIVDPDSGSDGLGNIGIADGKITGCPLRNLSL